MKRAFLLASAALAAEAAGSGIEQGYQDAKAAARGNAYVATADRASAVHYNPAGLSLQEGVESQLMLYGSEVDISFRGEGGDFDHSENRGTLAYFFNYAGLLEGDLAIGLGLTIPHGLGIEYDEDYPLRTLGYSGYLAHAVVSPAVSYRLNDEWSVGVALNYAYDDYELKQGIVAEGDEFRFNGKGDGWGYTAGLMFRPCDEWSFGLTYRSALTTELDGKTRTRTVFPTVSESREDGSASFDYPSQVVLGAAFRPRGKWDFEANIQWSEWSRFDEFRIKTDAGDMVAAFDYEDTLAFGMGATYTVDEVSALHFGYFYSEAAAPESTYNPLIANVDVHVFSAGYERRVGDWDFVATLLWVNGESRRVKGSPVNPISGVNADGRWESRSVVGLLGVSRSF